MSIASATVLQNVSRSVFSDPNDRITNNFSPLFTLAPWLLTPSVLNRCLEDPSLSSRTISSTYAGYCSRFLPDKKQFFFGPLLGGVRLWVSVQSESSQTERSWIVLITNVSFRFVQRSKLQPKVHKSCCPGCGLRHVWRSGFLACKKQVSLSLVNKILIKKSTFLAGPN